MLEAIVALFRQPLFVLLGAVLVLLVADADWRAGLVAAAVWAAWLWAARRGRKIF
jgi:hypothetical protein